MNEAPRQTGSSPEKWTKEIAEELRKKGWKNISEIKAFWSNREMHMPIEIEHVVNELRLSASPGQFREFEFHSKNNHSTARVYSPAYQQQVADALLKRYPTKAAKIEKARLKLPALNVED